MERKQTQIIPGTDLNVVGEVEQQYYDVLKILIDPQLEGLKSRIQILYTNLTQHLETQENHIRKCKVYKGDIDGYVGRISNCNKIIQEEIQRADTIKKMLEKMQSETQEFKKKQNEVKGDITRHRLQMNILQKQSIKGLEQIEIRQQNEENQLKKKYEEHIKIKEELSTKHTSLSNQHQYGLEEIGEIQTAQTDSNNKIEKLREKIKQIEIRNEREKTNDEQKKEELNRIKVEKDQKNQEKKKLENRIKQLDKEIAETNFQLKEEKVNKDEQQRSKIRQQKRKDQVDRQLVRKAQEKDKLVSLKTEREQEQEEEQKKLLQIQKQKEQIEMTLEYAKGKLNEIKNENYSITQKKNNLLDLKIIQSQSLQTLTSEREKIKGKIKQLLYQRIEKDKTTKVSENKQRELNYQNVEQFNKLKKITNEVTSYQVQQQKLSKVLQQIKREQEKYGIEASHAHSKYYQTLEELKIKNTQIQNLQKENQQVEKKCKHQQNLYEAVRSDRNLYSKDFMKSKEEISELKKKYKRMTYLVEQLRQQIKSKDQDLVELDKEFKKVEAQNTKIEADRNRAKSQIESTEQVIKNQDNHVGHLKKIIQEAKNQKAKQQKDYDMVRNERDILGTQLIKRNQELQQLYEKIKLSNSNLTKGDIYFKEKQREFNEKKIYLATQRNEFLSIDDQIRCIDDLKSEISFKEKELLNQRAKVKALEDELKNPMNVHRWRKLQATDQQNYERILKIQTLQRRLIAKTQEVEAKQNLIREKEKLFLELKNILARQPGTEIHHQLVKYKEALKQKSGQMKKMKKELEDAHEEMETGKFEVDRLKNQMAKMKREYFEMRQDSEKQVFDGRDFGEELMNLKAGHDTDKMFEINLKK